MNNYQPEQVFDRCTKSWRTFEKSNCIWKCKASMNQVSTSSRSPSTSSLSSSGGIVRMTWSESRSMTITVMSLVSGSILNCSWTFAGFTAEYPKLCRVS